MPVYLKQLSREAYCSAPPLPSYNIRPPRLTREFEARRPRAPLDAPFLDIKAEVSSIESVEFGVEQNEFEDFKLEVEIHLDPRQIGDLLQVRLAALAIRHPRHPWATKGKPQDHLEPQSHEASGSRANQEY